MRSPLGEAWFGGDPNPYIHTSNDRIAHFNLACFFALSKLAVAAIAHLSFYYLMVNLENESELFTSAFVLNQNYPNPFNSSTAIEFYLPRSAYTSLKIYNALGQNVSTLAAENLPAGNHKYQWDTGELASGMYFYRLEAG